MDIVSRLRFRVEPDGANILLPEIDNPTFRMVQEFGGLVTFTFKREISDDSAREIVTSFVNSWQGQSLFQTGARHRELIELDMHYASGKKSMTLLRINHQVVGVAAEANTRNQAPWLFHGFEKSSRASELIDRFQRYVCGNEPLQSAAYYCWTSLETWLGGKKTVASSLAVSPNVLEKLSRLLSIGDARTARKRAKGIINRELTPAEIFWLETTLRLLISRFGEREIDPAVQFKQCTLAKLPSVHAPRGGSAV